MDNDISVVSFDESEFDKLLGPDASVRSSQASFIYRYLRDGKKSNGVTGCTAMVVENTYHSPEYAAEYAAYYSSCFSGFSPFSRRVHFFGDLSPEAVGNELRKAFTGEDVDGATTRLQKGYLGFVALRPVAAVQIGYTCLVPYPRADDLKHANRVFLTRRRAVRLAGVKLSVSGAPFMQQDRSVAACATTAIWAALQLLPHESQGTPPNTVAITEGATRYKLRTRRFPARRGLDRDQMTEAIRQCGWAPEVMDPTLDLDLARILLGAYAHSDRPVVIIARRVEPNPERGLAHALVQVGVSDRNSPEDLAQWKTDSLTIQVPAPTKIYVHDDRIGPYMRAFVEMVSDPQYDSAPELPGLRLERDRAAKPPEVEKWAILGYLVPHHPSIRLNMLDLYNTNRSLIRTLHSIVFKTSTAFSLRMDMGLRYAQDYLGALPTQIRKPAEDAAQFFSHVSLPRFAGVVSVSLDGKPLYDLVWDTTDFCRSVATIWDHLLAVVTYTDDYRSGFAQLFAAMAAARPARRTPQLL